MKPVFLEREQQQPKSAQLFSGTFTPSRKMRLVVFPCLHPETGIYFLLLTAHIQGSQNRPRGGVERGIAGVSVTSVVLPLFLTSVCWGLGRAGVIPVYTKLDRRDDVINTHCLWKELRDCLHQWPWCQCVSRVFNCVRGTLEAATMT